MDIALNCLHEETYEILPSKLKGVQLLWFYDIDAHACKYIDGECVNSDNINKFPSYQACKSQCIPNVTEVQTQGEICLFCIFFKF